ncbi:hypothetical protein HS088_TW07G00374 [Tripterygium wilfordii]|uniref:Cyclin-dependent protein kinase inhibitor SMR2 n=1 Tax=Tripterygium wilfordii TaxID=458696 RepID=A0A7J7DES3_TRIWF|nr:cyclin-dependent protein kinase inhibitor SMR4-like [Tripterygium wilfordii]KAF5744794.1 hypothetical protein HS088_TW07G00374 [Tripterygium wilfordii]
MSEDDQMSKPNDPTNTIKKADGSSGEILLVDQVPEDQEEECKTPTSSDHKIPTSQSCPPTPRKKPHVFLHKRKISELSFFEATRRDQIEVFFRSPSCDEVSSTSVKKKRSRSY